jgi:hypothetical protein
LATIDFPSKAKERIYKQFPPLSIREMPHPDKIKTIEIEYERQGIEEYDVVFWHRLLKSIYQEPHEMECELHIINQSNKGPESAIWRRLEEKSKWEILGSSEDIAVKIQAGEIKPFPVNWKYFFRLPSGGIIEVGTKDQRSVFYFAHVSGQVKVEDHKQGERFIDLLLEEAKKEARNKLFDPLKEFCNKDRLKFYQLFNVYRANYVSAEFMLGVAVDQEKYLREEFLRYDARTHDLHEEEKRNHIDQFMLACGMYFSSSITYYFMALEGFLNIVFHSFLKKNLRDSGLNIEKKFDIEQKLKLLPVLCDGFLHEQYTAPSDLYSKFRKLTDYRNSIFHSKVEEALKSLSFFEDGFLYNCDVGRYKEQFLPAHKIMLSASHVMKVKKIVDEIIDMILNSMTDDVRQLTDKHILKSTQIPFFILKDGSLALGRSQKEQNETNRAQQKNQPDRD